MAFLSPIWLLGLLPWVGLCLFMMWGRRKRRFVPFAKLWQHLPHQARVERRIIPPPIFVVLVLVGLLLVILAASGPMVRRPGVPESTLTIVVDRGLTMSASSQGKPRYVVASSELQEELRKLYRRANVRLRFVPEIPDQPEGQSTDLASFARLIEQTRPTALDTHRQLLPTLKGIEAEAPGPVLVVTDADLGQPSTPSAAARAIQVTPSSQMSNVRIDAVAARSTPRPQVMVRVHNDSAMTKAVLRVQPSEEDPARMIERTVDLPAKGKQADYFFDVTGLGAWRR